MPSPVNSETRRSFPEQSPSGRIELTKPNSIGQCSHLTQSAKGAQRETSAARPKTLTSRSVYSTYCGRTSAASAVLIPQHVPVGPLIPSPACPSTVRAAAVSESGPPIRHCPDVRPALSAAVGRSARVARPVGPGWPAARPVRPVGQPDGPDRDEMVARRGRTARRQ